MKWKKLGKALLFPHIAIMIALVPIATVFLVYSMVYLGTESVTAIISYVLAFYTLTVWCIKIPYLIHCFKTFKEDFAKRSFGNSGITCETVCFLVVASKVFN